MRWYEENILPRHAITVMKRMDAHSLAHIKNGSQNTAEDKE
jgi:hypothetical protein